MKKILTLMMAIGTFATLHAQTREETRRVILGERKDNGGYDNRNNRDVVYDRSGNDRYPGTYSNNRQFEVDRINREYDNKIASIRNNRYLSRAEKEKMIRQLERDRQQRIANINRGYNNRNRDYDDNDRYTRNDNGKHKGWYKKMKNNNWKKGNRNRNRN